MKLPYICATILNCSPVPQLETDIDHAHIYTSASETGYEPIDHDIHTIHEVDEKEEDMLDNLAYGKTDSGEKEVTGLTKLQHEAADMKLKGNESYNLTTSTSAQDEGEYSYAAFSVISPA